MNLLDKNAENLKKLYKTKDPSSVTIYNFFPFKKLSFKEKKDLLNKRVQKNTSSKRKNKNNSYKSKKKESKLSKRKVNYLLGN